MKLIPSIIVLVTFSSAVGQEMTPHSNIINCDEIKTTLEHIYDIDQANRGKGKEIDESIDLQNQSKVVAIIEHCGWPDKTRAGAKGMQAVFLVIQHSSRNTREQYFPLIKERVNKGDLSPRAVAMMEDRMLMEQRRNKNMARSLSAMEMDR